MLTSSFVPQFCPYFPFSLLVYQHFDIQCFQYMYMEIYAQYMCRCSSKVVVLMQISIYTHTLACSRCFIQFTYHIVMICHYGSLTITDRYDVWHINLYSSKTFCKTSSLMDIRIRILYEAQECTVDMLNIQLQFTGTSHIDRGA